MGGTEAGRRVAAPRGAAVALVVALGAPAPAAAQGPGPGPGDVGAGRRIAETWCANCHVIGPAARGPAGDAAPPFAAVARMPSTTEMSLRVFLQTPHARMPDYRLSRRELDDVVAYLLSLRGPR